MTKVLVYKDRLDLIAATLELMIEKISAAITERQTCSIVLSGGSTPTPLYAALTTAELPWHKIQIYWGDERYVSSTHPDSNYGTAKQVWLDLVPIPSENIHPMPTDFAMPQMAADAYEREIQSNFGLEAGSIPTFDIILLGMGDDGHTASLFPHTDALSVVDRLVTIGDKDGQPRLTFTSTLINHARNIIFLVAGASKKPALAAVFAPTGDASLYPSRLIQHYSSEPTSPERKVLWLLDAAAGE